MKWYVLYSLSYKTEKLVRMLNKKEELEAFIPQLEYYRRDIKGYAIKPLFPGYIFVLSRLNQLDFDVLLMNMKEDKDGLIKQLKYNDTTALTYDEIDMFEKLLDSSYVLRMSQAVLVNDKAVVYQGPLRNFEKDIVKVDKHNQLAYLDIKFMNRYIQAGLVLKSKN